MLVVAGLHLLARIPNVDFIVEAKVEARKMQLAKINKMGENAERFSRDRD
jgi:hypothetical protein